MRAAGEEGRDLADAIGDGFNSRVCRFCVGSAQSIDGDLAEAAAQFGEVAAEAEVAHDDTWRVLSLGGQSLAPAFRVRWPRPARRLWRPLRAARRLAGGSRYWGTQCWDSRPWPPGWCGGARGA
jgi:hypothetical protein